MLTGGETITCVETFLYNLSGAGSMRLQNVKLTSHGNKCQNFSNSYDLCL
uniref:Uncharacterized protein n=1 Tax=Rhizophora mucronata TaxID=61149 RepID=A0A2P2PSH4_RHIMU